MTPADVRELDSDRSGAKRLRIAYLHYLYGADTALHHVRLFTDAARALGHDVRVHALNLAPSGEDASDRQRAREWLKTRLSRYLHEPKELAWNLRYAARELAIIRAERPDVLLVREHHLTCAEALVRAVTGVPLVLEVNAPGSEESARYLNQYAHVPLVGRLTDKWKLRAADRVVVVSDGLRQHLVAQGGVALERVVVNPNGADCERFHPEVDGSEIRRRHGLLDDDVVVGFVGSLYAWRGPEVLRELIVQACAPGVRFLLVGAGAGWPELRAWLQSRPHAASVVMAGALPHAEVPAAVAAMDIAFIPDSAFYMSPLKLLEYMAAGRAIVAPRIGGIAELIEDGVHGLLFPPQDVQAAVAAIDRLRRDAALRRRLGAAARQHVLTALTWRDNATRVIAACEAAIGGRADRPRLAAQPVSSAASADGM